MTVFHRCPPLFSQTEPWPLSTAPLWGLDGAPWVCEATLTFLWPFFLFFLTFDHFHCPIIKFAWKLSSFLLRECFSHRNTLVDLHATEWAVWTQGKWVSGRSQKEWGIDLRIGSWGLGRWAASEKLLMLGEVKDWGRGIMSNFGCVWCHCRGGVWTPLLMQVFNALAVR